MSGGVNDGEQERKDVQLRVRGCLAASRVRLWLPPFTDPDSNQRLQDLAEEYGRQLKLNAEKVLVAIKELQVHSIERAAANERFKETGIACLRATLSSPFNGIKKLSIQIQLVEEGAHLISNIAQQLSVEIDRIKLIHSGRVIDHKLPLAAQNIKNGGQILVIILTGTPDDMQKNDDMYSTLVKTTSDAELLSEDFKGESYVQLEDQSGKALNLPAKEKKALTVAMTLHEKGRSALKAKNYSLALIFLLEADKHFSQCNSEILQSVDNYGLLNLDISWCYLCLQSPTHIPDAEARLTVCEKNFHKSYGKKLERLIALKGTSGNEKALFMRLHLLQGIVNYHLNKRTVAKTLLVRAQQELNGLKINESSLVNLVEMGYTLSEARRGLRASEGSVQGACDFIAKARKQKIEKAKKDEEDRESRALGLCDDQKQFVSVQFLKMLTDMGYSKTIAVLALKKANNIVGDAVSIIQEKSEMLIHENLLNNLSNEIFSVDPNLVQQLVNIGYDSSMATEALKRSFNDLNKAIDLLSKCGGLIIDYVDDTSTAEDAGPSTSIHKQEKKKRKKMAEAFSRLSEGIENTDDDYLDIPLDQEEQYLQEYLGLLE